MVHFVTGQGILLFSTVFKLALRPTLILLLSGFWELSQRVEWQGQEADNSSSIFTEVKVDWINASTT
jgi:hypothetical protein